MNLNDLKPVWKDYKNGIEEQDYASEASLYRLLEPHFEAPSAYKKLHRMLLNSAVCLLLLTITSGC